MKSLKSISLFILLAIIAASCGSSDNSPLAKKKEELAKQKL